MATLKKIAFLPLLLLCGLAHADRVYIYTLSVTASFKRNRDITALMAKSLTAKEKCIDMRGSFGSDEGGTYGDVKLVLNERLSPATEEKLREAACGLPAMERQGLLMSLLLPSAHAGIGRVPINNCKFGVSFVSADLSKVRFQTWTNGTRSRNSYPVGSEKIPALSKSCQTGDYEDSWNDALGTPEGQKFAVKQAGDISNTDMVGLSVAGENYTLGFVKDANLISIAKAAGHSAHPRPVVDFATRTGQ